MPTFQSVPLRNSIHAAIVPPGSKSITNRAQVLAALCDEPVALTGVLESEDTAVMRDAVTHIRRQSPQCTDIYVADSGTTARFLTAVLAFYGSPYRLYGKARMHQRPIKDLVDALRQLGANIDYEQNEGYPPLVIHGTFRTVSSPALCTIAGSVSSQFLTGLLLAAPLAAKERDVEIRVLGELVSKPYVDMTLRMMETFGVQPETDDDGVYRFSKGIAYRSPKIYRIEPDASAASYFFAASAVCGGTVTVKGLSKHSLQGDVHFVDCLEKMGCDVVWKEDSITVSRPADRKLQGIRVDMNSFSDTAQTLAVVALFAEGATEIINIEHNRYKETDRIANLAIELRKFGAAVSERQDGLLITPQTTPPGSITIATYDDHRMAMSFAVAGLRIPNVLIADPDCTKKTFPDFWKVLDTL